ncbi:hypothetical protein EDB81DRAFT_759823 [Dactylonectria macrodidyma]|uniref:Uncharacterized protein n=1 Tax=Dactylonectria macrodidyma TaxID=307937 RepID=A0A9P9EWE5_9HYPO|nr:hypothetical protein EDB81DRAFT_759823 [Dactylonectria macrodidyma]
MWRESGTLRGTANEQRAENERGHILVGRSEWHRVPLVSGTDPTRTNPQRPLGRQREALAMLGLVWAIVGSPLLSLASFGLSWWAVCGCQGCGLWLSRAALWRYDMTGMDARVRVYIPGTEYVLSQSPCYAAAISNPPTPPAPAPPPIVDDAETTAMALNLAPVRLENVQRKGNRRRVRAWGPGRDNYASRLWPDTTRPS